MTFDRRQLLVLMLAGATSPAYGQAAMSSRTAYTFSFQSLNGEPINLADYTGKPLLIVNTASLCGFTPQISDTGRGGRCSGISQLTNEILSWRVIVSGSNFPDIRGGDVFENKKRRLSGAKPTGGVILSAKLGFLASAPGCAFCALPANETPAKSNPATAAESAQHPRRE